jgi:hypothetical protein
MKASLKLKALAAAAALFATGSAFANTNLDTANLGSIWVNVDDTSNSTSFAYDTGLNQSTVTGSTTSFSVDTSLASDPNWQSFLSNTKSGDNITYNVVSLSGLGAGGATIYTTGAAKPSSVQNANISTPANAAETVAGFINSTASTTSNSAYITAGNSLANWSTNLDGGSWGGNLGGVQENASLGTSLNFYEILGTTAVKATVSTFAYTWDLTSAGLLTYNPTTSTVPVPAPFGLLVAGLALMGVIARRGKSTGGDFGGAAA